MGIKLKYRLVIISLAICSLLLLMRRPSSDDKGRILDFREALNDVDPNTKISKLNREGDPDMDILKEIADDFAGHVEANTDRKGSVLERLAISEDTLSYRQKRYDSYQGTMLQRQGPGENGSPVYLSESEKLKVADAFKKEGFNVIASQKISLERNVPDVRHHLCKQQVYPEELPTASVVIIYYNEEWSAILRTVHSIVNRTPPKLLKEIILLDDASNRTELGDPLKRYISLTWPDGVVRIIRSAERGGLIKARQVGAEAVTGDVIVFLDAHCEVNHVWLEPLLARIKESRTAVLCPTIDQISDHVMAYSGGYDSSSIGTFWWSLHFSWSPMPEHEKKRRQTPIDPIRSPTMAGGLLAMDRKFFFELGGYDTKMEIWGGENLEMSFRTWMCGGTLEFIPCSHVGHIFRSVHPYGFPSKTKDYHGLNSKRLAEVWMDEYKRLFYMQRRDLVNKEVGDLSERKALRERLGCKSFQWFLDNVYPQKFISDVGVRAWGEIRNPTSNLCLDTLATDEKTSFTLGLYYCQEQGSWNQAMSLTLEGMLRREEACADVAIKRGKSVIVMSTACGQMQNVKWNHDKDSGQLRHENSGLCVDSDGLKSGDFVQMNPCKTRYSQKWEIENYLV